MKSLPRKLLPLILFGIAVTSLFSVQPAQAYTVTLQQMGSNVVATGSGAINLTGLTPDRAGFSFPALNASLAEIRTGEANQVTFYIGFTGPTSFGSGGDFSPNASSGDHVGIVNTFFPGLLVPQGYVSNTALSDSMTFDNATIHSLGLTPGTYVWSWGTGTGLSNQNFTLIIRGVGVPDGGSTVSMLGFALLGLAALRRKLAC